MKKKEEIKKTSIQLIKYGLVGVSNSLITLAVIYVFNAIIGINILVADVIGYVAGIINSFVWNKQWVFKSHNHRIKREIGLFFFGFLICFALQWLALWVLVTFTPIRDISAFGIKVPEFGDYLAVCFGMVIYTLSNYLYNRFITFKPVLQ